MLGLPGCMVCNGFTHFQPWPQLAARRPQTRRSENPRPKPKISDDRLSSSNLPVISTGSIRLLRLGGYVRLVQGGCRTPDLRTRIVFIQVAEARQLAYVQLGTAAGTACLCDLLCCTVEVRFCFPHLHGNDLPMNVIMNVIKTVGM